MQPKELLPILSQLKNVDGLEKLDKLRPCRLKWPPKSDTTSDPEEVRQKIKEFAPEQGWLCFQSKVDYFRELAKMSFSGILLYGEVVKKATNQSLHIREEGQNGWILTYFEETKGEQYLVENTVFCGEKELAPNKLRYRVYWQHDEKQGYRQLGARFNGFTDT
ncbi:MAG TPA: hypothetical protein EYP59_18875 [Thiotrichaceae bacterium]|nr:hypothetical protein [Thiotrichaceae bacterium]